MDSPRLSAGGLRFLGLRVPLEDSALLASGLPAQPDSNGVSTFRTDEMRSGGMPSLLRGRMVSLRNREAVLLQCRSVRSASLAQHRRVSHVAATKGNGASTMVHLRSSLRSSPSPAPPYGSGRPWTFPLAMQRFVTYYAHWGRDCCGHSTGQESSPLPLISATSCRKV